VRASANGQSYGEPPEAPDPPDDLQTPGRSTWALLWTLPQIFYPDDALAVARLCRLEDEASALRTDMLMDSGPTCERIIQNAKGDVIGREPFAHPALGQLGRIGMEVAELCASLGLGPVARHNLGLEVQAREPDLVDELKHRRAMRRAGMKRAAESGEA